MKNKHQNGSWNLPTWSLTKPLKIGHPTGKVIFQPPFFRGYVKLQGCNDDGFQCHAVLFCGSFQLFRQPQGLDKLQACNTSTLLASFLRRWSQWAAAPIFCNEPRWAQTQSKAVSLAMLPWQHSLDRRTGQSSKIRRVAGWTHILRNDQDWKSHPPGDENSWPFYPPIIGGHFTFGFGSHELAITNRIAKQDFC